MDDLISRKAAIYAAREELESGTYFDIPSKIEALPAVQPDHSADIGKKVSISCGHENDLIFREMAIEALARMMPRSYTPDGSHPADEEIFKAQEIYVDCIESIEILPAVQPDVPDMNVGDMISRQMAIDAIEHRLAEPAYQHTGEDWYVGMNCAESEIYELPSAQPEIIRCKECAHRDEYGCCRCWKGQAMSENPIPTDDYDFCSMAKRRGDG